MPAPAAWFDSVTISTTAIAAREWSDTNENEKRTRNYSTRVEYTTTRGKESLKDFHLFFDFYTTSSHTNPPRRRQRRRQRREADGHTTFPNPHFTMSAYTERMGNSTSTMHHLHPLTHHHSRYRAPLPQNNLKAPSPHQENPSCKPPPLATRHTA